MSAADKGVLILNVGVAVCTFVLSFFAYDLRSRVQRMEDLLFSKIKFPE